MGATTMDDLAVREERARRESADAAQEEQSSRGYRVLGFYSATCFPSTSHHRLSIRTRVLELTRDLDAVLKCHGMSLKDVLD